MPFVPETKNRFTPEAPSEPSISEKAKAFGYGAATGFAGGPGELEKFGAQTVPEAVGLSSPEERGKFMGRETFFPTMSEVGKSLQKIGVTEPREEVGGWKTAGELIGGLGTSVPSILKTGVTKLLGTPTKTTAYLAKIAEDLGFKLSPAQLRADVPVSQKGATGWSKENQTLANKLASEGTGQKATEINGEFISGRLKDLGGQYDKLYKGNVFNIDKDAVDTINQIRAMEMQLPGIASSSQVKQVADSIVANFKTLSRRPNADPNTFGIEGEALQRLRNALTQQARGTNPGNARELYNLVDVIDASVAKNHPKIAAELNALRPKYRNTIILEDLYKAGGIKQGNISLEQLGTMLRGKRDAVRGSASDIDHLGELGRELKLQARWQQTGSGGYEGVKTLSDILGTTIGAGATGLGLRSRPARFLQKKFSGPNVGNKYAPNYPEVTATGTFVQPFQQEE